MTADRPLPIRADRSRPNAPLFFSFRGPTIGANHTLQLPPRGYFHMKTCLTNFLALCFLIVVVVFIIRSCSQNSSEPLIISRAEMGDDWPFTVENGELRCDRDRVTFHTDGKMYALNGAAKTFSSNAKDILEISRANPAFVMTPENPVRRLDESVRREVVKQMAECRAGRISNVGFEQCPEFINAKFKIDEEERERIVSEGMILGWDPHRLPGISLGSLIDLGLELCGS